MDTATKHLMSDCVNTLFAILLTTRHWRSGLRARVPGRQLHTVR